MTWALAQTTGNPTRKVVLLALADRASQDDWSCWPSQTTIANETELGERTVRRALLELEQLGLIGRVHRMRVGGRGRWSDMYTLAGGPARLSTADPSTGQSGRLNTPVDNGVQPATDDRSTGHSGQGTVREPKKKILTSSTSFTRDEPEPVDISDVTIASLTHVDRYRSRARQVYWDRSFPACRAKGPSKAECLLPTDHDGDHFGNGYDKWGPKGSLGWS